ncbi:hypothetical protein PAESOLCIP111_06611 [Paenibacillus solanacearum]|uniref:Uncharacterized protein n=1 Tax=Paenibacillus solanacearum TaxID=2048548 RepID=A0A916NS90_9BACL|nr:hypothetical protein PAESOLCIP111_06611 [Paenibacillus solanacearum]
MFKKLFDSIGAKILNRKPKWFVINIEVNPLLACSFLFMEHNGMV